ncbi:unnamed protein product, partial [Cyprideis torosa]
MLDPETGVAIRRHKLLLTSINDAIAGYDLIEWLMEHFGMDDSTEALHLAQQMCYLGFLYPVSETKDLTVKDDSSIYRFHPTNQWPSPNFEPSQREYALYLLKRQMRDRAKHALEEYEQEDLLRDQTVFCPAAAAANDGVSSVSGEEDICPWDAQVPASPKGKPRIRLPTRALVQAIASVTSKSKELAQASAGTSSGASANTDPSSKRPCDGGTGRYCGIGAAGPSSSLTKVSREAIFYMGKSESSASVSIGDDVCPWESGPPSGTSSISSQKQLLVPEGKPQQKKSASVPEDVGCKDGTPSMASLK